MRGRACALVWVLAALPALPAWAGNEPAARVIGREMLDIQPIQSGAASLQLTAVRFLDGGWERDALDAAFRQSAALLLQCGIRLTRVELLLVEAPKKFQFYFTPVSRELARSMALPRPTLYFVRDSLNRPAFDAEAIGRSNSRTRPELRDSIWVALGTRDLGIALAHELVHLLADRGEHATAPANLMRAETAAQNTVLEPAQCERMNRSGREGGLLQ